MYEATTQYVYGTKRIRIMYLLLDQLSIDQADKRHLVGQYLKISGYFKACCFPSRSLDTSRTCRPPKLIKDYYRL
ncbi:hypothetical protein L202_05013 [Cryptococcus amylolentus CBS 6039]|uniref:Uncharacterized protein n=1 Tax=Cryptococcus amylolentus CBS 6039 TaxID=1295533 RepID=A0A1E3HNJ3_9TREE|nr:hypothetical protein L202_05013 [Cryptococcus amylolentus CBS 6039]ODN77907.1 hypothetical protein L202_05013 [Cryptococcus amylolentus CBS 6039]